MKVPEKLTKTRNYILLILLLTFVPSCKKSEHNVDNDFKNSNIENVVNIGYVDTTTAQPIVDKSTANEQQKIYRYATVDGNVVEAETVVLFVDGKKDELQITIDMPNIMTSKFNLIKQKSLGLIKGVDTYIYNSPADHNKEVTVFFNNGCKMMGMTLDKQNYVFFNNTTPEQIDDNSTEENTQQIAKEKVTKAQKLAVIDSNDGLMININNSKVIEIQKHLSKLSKTFKLSEDRIAEIIVRTSVIFKEKKGLNFTNLELLRIADTNQDIFKGSGVKFEEVMSLLVTLTDKK